MSHPSCGSATPWRKLAAVVRKLCRAIEARSPGPRDLLKSWNQGNIPEKQGMTGSRMSADLESPTSRASGGGGGSGERAWARCCCWGYLFDPKLSQSVQGWN
jgi:hypothetical protein